MELSDNDIDKLFRDNLSDLNLNFNPKDWNNMQRKMRAKKWRKFILLGLLALISTSLIAYLFITNLPTKNNLTNNANTANTNTVTQTTNTINETSVLNNEINNSNEISKEDINTNSANENSLNSANSFINNAPHNVNNSSRNSVNTGSNNPFKEEQKLSNKQGNNITKQNTNLLGDEAKNSTNSLSTTTTSNGYTDNSSSNNSNTVSNNSGNYDNSSNDFNLAQNNLDENSGKTLANNSNNKPFGEENLAGNIDNKINSVSDSDNLIKFTSNILDESISLTLDTTLNSLQKMKDTVVWKHAFGLELYPNLNNYIGYNLGSSQSSYQYALAKIESKTLKNIDFGVNYSFLRNKKIDLSTGIHYTRIGYKIIYTNEVYTETETSKFHFIDLRGDLNYHFNRKKFSPFISVAPELNILLGGYRNTTFSNDSVSVDNRGDIIIGAQNISASINLGAGVNYSLSKKWEMYLQINLKTFMFPTVSSTTFFGVNGELLTPQSYGFKLGIRRNSYKTIQIPVN